MINSATFSLENLTCLSLQGENISAKVLVNDVKGSRYSTRNRQSVCESQLSFSVLKLSLKFAEFVKLFCYQ